LAPAEELCLACIRIPCKTRSRTHTELLMTREVALQKYDDVLVRPDTRKRGQPIVSGDSHRGGCGSAATPCHLCRKDPSSQQHVAFVSVRRAVGQSVRVFDLLISDPACECGRVARWNDVRTAASARLAADREFTTAEPQGAQAKRSARPPETTRCGGRVAPHPGTAGHQRQHTPSFVCQPTAVMRALQGFGTGERRSPGNANDAPRLRTWFDKDEKLVRQRSAASVYDAGGLSDHG